MMDVGRGRSACWRRHHLGLTGPALFPLHHIPWRSGGRCDCPAGLTVCGAAPGTCVNTETSNAHCGGCNAACGAGRACVRGKCG